MLSRYTRLMIWWMVLVRALRRIQCTFQFIRLFVCLFLLIDFCDVWILNHSIWCLFVSTHSICLTTHFIRYFIKISLMPNKNNDQLIYFMSFCVRCITESFTLLRCWLKNYSTINPEKYCHRPGTKFSHLAKFHSFHSIFEIINGQNA